ncbi:Alpha/Beta hydrolase protein [Pelagophyceae sp. CCMP2097]|nr:Alpha/Beta hydrolase protein [Pelagophyceae sp. CCMP2097]
MVWFSQFWPARLWAEARRCEVQLLDLSGREYVVKDTPVTSRIDDTIHSVSVRGAPSGTKDIVLVHGFMCGTGIFWRNLGALAAHAGIRSVTSVDWRGAGLSGRALPYAPTSHDEAVDFLVEGLEQWRRAHYAAAGESNRKFVLVGHSMGAIVTANYAARYPGAVEHLILCGPAAVEASPMAPGIVDHPVYKFAAALWTRGTTPGYVVRGLGPFGDLLVRNYVQRRFREGVLMRDEEAEALTSYLQCIMHLPGASEQAMSQILGPIAAAKVPLGPLVEQLGCPVTYVYGASDWMQPARGLRSAERMAAAGKDARCLVLKNAGHYPFLDQPDAFNGLLLQRIFERPPRSKRWPF